MLCEAVEEKRSKYQNLMLFLDYDGTLSLIAPSPEKAKPVSGIVSTLNKLSHKKRVKIMIISGRSLKDIERQFKLDSLMYAGNHGLELSASGSTFTHPSSVKQIPIMARIAAELECAIKNIEGALLENKKMTLSVHYRRVSKSNVRALKSTVLKVIRNYLEYEVVKLTHGKRVLEIRPNNSWHKGALIKWLLEQKKKFGIKPATLFMYIGDDETDESGFRQINKLGGLSVSVGPDRHRTAAKFLLKDPKEVALFLKCL